MYYNKRFVNGSFIVELKSNVVNHLQRGYIEKAFLKKVFSPLLNI